MVSWRKLLLSLFHIYQVCQANRFKAFQAANKESIWADRSAMYTCVCVCVHWARSDMRATCVMSFRTLTLVYLMHLMENKGVGQWRALLFGGALFSAFLRSSGNHLSKSWAYLQSFLVLKNFWYFMVNPEDGKRGNTTTPFRLFVCFPVTCMMNKRNALKSKKKK